MRYCAKVALAAFAAYALTLGERNDYALYSVLGAALVVGGSVGEDLHASFNRVRGVGFGWGTAALRVGIAMALVVLFSHADDVAEYGGWRVLNTLIGVSIGVAVSRLVWPLRGREEVARAIDRALDAISAALDALARGASSDTLLPLQREVLDALSALSTARTNARLAQQLDPNADLLSAQTVLAVRAAIDTLAASLRLDELVQTGAREECLLAVRNVIAPLGVLARETKTGTSLAADFTARHEVALREAEHADIDAGTRVLLAVILNELQHVRAALHDLRL